MGKDFESRIRFFKFLISEGIQILQKGKDGNYYEYCDTATVPEETKDGLAVVLADMTFNCPVRILIGGQE